MSRTDGIISSSRSAQTMRTRSSRSRASQTLGWVGHGKMKTYDERGALTLLGFCEFFHSVEDLNGIFSVDDELGVVGSNECECGMYSSTAGLHRDL